MSLEHKLKTEEKGLLGRFLNSAKSKLSKAIFGATLTAMPVLGCDNGGGGGGTPTPTNNTPVINSSAVTNAFESQLYTYDVNATDADNDTLTYSLVTAPAGAGINNGNGIITWNPGDNGGVDYNENFSVQVSDGKGGTDLQNFTVNVKNAGLVTINTVDIDGNGLTNLEVKLTNALGTYTIASTSGGTTGNLFVPNGTYTLQVRDTVTPYTTIFNFSQPNVITSGNLTTLTNAPQILMGTISSTNTAYKDSQNNPSFLQLFKHSTGTLTSSAPAGGPHITQTWTSYPVSVFLNAANAPSTDNLDANLNSNPDGIPDEVNIGRLALSHWNTTAGMTLFTEVSSDPTTGIKFDWLASVTGGGNGYTRNDSYNADGSFKHTTLEIKTGLATSTSSGVQRHELGHSIYARNHAADNIYILYTTGNSNGNVHSDEGRVAKYNAKLPHGTNMDWYIDQ